MKRKQTFKLARTAMLLLVMLCSLGAWADDSGNCGDNVTYSYVESSHTLTISGTGAMAYYSDPSDQPWYSYKGDITTVIIENGVTTIGFGAFKDCVGLTSVEIPASVTTIREEAFRHCTSLESITIPANVTSILDYAFDGCKNLETVYVMAMTPPTLGGDVFNDCASGLVIAVPSAAYDSYYSATGWSNYQSKLRKNIATCSATVPNQTLEGPNNPFSAITYKFEYANNNYSDISAKTFIDGMDIVVKDGDTPLSLGTDYLFGSVTYANGALITESEIGDECKVEIIGLGDYAGSKWETFKVIAPDAGGKWGDIYNLTWVFHDGTLTITGTGEMTAADNFTKYPWCGSADYITSIIIDEGVTSIAKYAFGSDGSVTPYSGVTSVTLPSTLKTIGDNAFAYCGLTSINIPASVTRIGDTAFNQCNSLTSITLNGEVIIGLSALPSNAFVTIADGLYLHNGYEVISGFIHNISMLNFKVLTLPTYNVTANQDPAHAGEYWSTFYHPAASYQVGTNEKAYIGKLSGGSVTLTQITDGFIPKGTAVVLKAISDDDTYSFSLSRTEDDAFKNYDDDNDLVGGDQRIPLYDVYTLAARNNVVGFYKFKGAELNPNKAHLEINPSSSTREFFGFELEEEEADGIGSINNEQLIINNEAGEVYDLAGRKVNSKLKNQNSKLPRGIYISNGCKVLY